MENIQDEIEFTNGRHYCPQCKVWPMVKHDKLNWAGLKQWVCRNCERKFVRTEKYWVGSPIDKNGDE